MLVLASDREQTRLRVQSSTAYLPGPARAVFLQLAAFTFQAFDFFGFFYVPRFLFLRFITCGPQAVRPAAVVLASCVASHKRPWAKHLSASVRFQLFANPCK
jgi:hypothetical protein